MKRRNIYQKRLILKRSLFVSLIILFFSFFLYRIAYSKFMYSGSVSGISVVPAKITGLAITYGNEINTEGKDYPISVKEGGTVLFNITDPIPSKIYVNDVEWPGYSCNNGRLLIDNITEDINITAEYNSMDKAIFKPNIRSTMISLAGSPSSITAIKYSDIIPEEVSPTDVADSSSETSINMWYSSGTIYWNSSNKNPIFSGNRTQELYYLSSLADIEGLRTWDTEGLTSMEGLLQGNTRINSVEALKYWNTSSVTNMKSLFNGLNTLTNISGLENWDVSHVEDMTSLFTDTYVNNITPISKWDMSNVTKISRMFQGDGGLNNIIMGCIKRYRNGSII